jgi:hypothetical protein
MIKKQIKRRKYARIPYRIKLKKVGKETKLFILLHGVLGYNAVDSYMIAFPQSRANRASASAMASKLLRDAIVQENVEYLHGYALYPGFIFNENARKFLDSGVDDFED